MIKRVTPSGEDRPGESRMARWSRLKQEARSEPEKLPAVAEAEKTAALTPAAAPPDAAGGEKDDPLKDLPLIESLGKDSDYSMFMREGVPDERRAEALRKLWTSDPAFQEAFPFEMHMEDYHATFTPIDALKDTIYRAGRGFLTPEDLAAQSGEVAEKTKEEIAAERTDATGPGDAVAGAMPDPDIESSLESSPETLRFPDEAEGQAALAPEPAVDKPDKPA